MFVAKAHNSRSSPILQYAVTIGLLLSLLSIGEPAKAQPYPNRPLRLVVPAAPGGALDVFGRLIAKGLSQELKQNSYVENRPGANMMVGTDVVAKSAPDGHTLLYVSNSALTVSPYVMENMQLDPLRELLPVLTISQAPYILIANKSVAGSLKELAALLRASPGKLNHASNSASTILVSELFKGSAGLDYVDVNFRGASAALLATQAGTTQFAFVDTGSGAIALQNDQLRALGVTTTKRYPLTPDIPTFVEQGFAELDVMSTTVLLVPKNTPRNIFDLIEKATRNILQDAEFGSRLRAMGHEIDGQPGDEAHQALVAAAGVWKRLLKDRNIVLKDP